ncbi:MAG: 30S ribosomal protein S6 [Patescibacteria group bacterium]
MKEKDEMLDDVQVYEVGFHILPTVPEEKLPELVLKIKDSITQNGGEIISDDFPKMRVLAYEIKKRVETKYSTFNKAYFGWVKFEILPVFVAKLKTEMETNPDVLRFIIIKTVRENTMHSPKAPMVMKTGATEEVKIPEFVPTEKVEISEADIDKSIDELLINEN